MRFEKKVEQLRIQKHGGRETEDFLHDVVKMAEGEPLEYIVGEVDFCGATVDLSLRPMIPRKETEYWVKQLLEAQGEMGSSRALDLFSGSGCVGLAIAKHYLEAIVDCIEYDEKLKKQIEISLIKNKMDSSRVSVITGDTWNGATGLYDIITAVPPYVPPHMKEEVMKELHAEEPLSFFDKEDGYYYHKQVLSRAKEFLNDGGSLYLEFDITQREKIEEFAKEYGLENIHFLVDPYGHEFVLVCIK